MITTLRQKIELGARLRQLNIELVRLREKNLNTHAGESVVEDTIEFQRLKAECQLVFDEIATGGGPIL